VNLTLTELEQAINYWRRMRPSQGEERALSAEVNALADVYALMIFHRAATLPLDDLSATARELIVAWRDARRGNAA
jgi:hypothetical protein